MKPIDFETIEKIEKRISEMTVREVPRLIDNMREEQPLVLVYLLSAGGSILNRDERELLLYMGIIIWQAMSQGDVSPPKVTEKILDEMERKNIRMLEELEETSEREIMDTMEKMIETYSQPTILKYVLETLIEEPGEEDYDIRDENKGLIFIFLKTVIDSLNK